MKRIETCITPEGTFRYGVHKPSYSVTNLRQETKISSLGLREDGRHVSNTRNYPGENLRVTDADWIFEIPNPLPFRGRTFIDKEWADASAKDPGRIRLPEPLEVSFSQTLKAAGISENLIGKLPEPLMLALATTSNDPDDLVKLAHLSCALITEEGRPTGLRYSPDDRGSLKPVIHNHVLFEAIANNPSLPDEYKIAMVIRPGAQGGSEIIGEWLSGANCHVYEYLRRNSYIGGGHYAANMAEDAIRYSIDALRPEDMKGLRHLYYQRTYVRLAEELGLGIPRARGMLSEDELEALRLAITGKITDENPGSATLWGWNFGFDYAPTGYRLHASHQQIHQQYALIPDQVSCYSHGTEVSTGKISAYSCGDLVTELINDYSDRYGSDFFNDYRQAIATNKRMDGRDELESDLVVWHDERVMLFVPKAQTSQWELQLMTLPDSSSRLAGNIVECDQRMRSSIDTGILKAQKALGGLGGKMVTSIEYSKRIGEKKQLQQPLLYAFLPRLPESPGAFSEAQLRFISGHYPEDFAAALRKQLA